MSDSDTDLPQDVTFTKITVAQAASLETAFRKSAAACNLRGNIRVPKDVVAFGCGFAAPLTRRSCR